MPCEIKSRATAKHSNNYHVLDVPKSLSAHDCLIGVTDEQLRGEGEVCCNSSASNSTAAVRIGVDHLLPPRNPNYTSSRQQQQSAANNVVKPRGWYATRKSYRSVAYKTWTVGAARKLLNSQNDLSAVDSTPSPSPVPNGSVSDSEDKYYSAVESDFEDSCAVPGCRSCSTAVAAIPRKCVSTEIFYTPMAASKYNCTTGKSKTNNNNNNNNNINNNNLTSRESLPLTVDSLKMSCYPDPSPGCSDQEETDCYSSADYCRFTQKRNGFRQNQRVVRSFDDALDSTNDGGEFDEELQTVMDTFQDLRNLRKSKQQEILAKRRSRSPFANTSQALVKKIQQVLPNLHINKSSSSHHAVNGTCKSSHSVDLLAASASSDDLNYYEPTNNHNNNDNNINNDDNNTIVNDDCFQDSSTSTAYLGNTYNNGYNNFSFTNSEDALEYLKNELINIRQRDFLILQQLRHVENELNTKKFPPNQDLVNGAPSTTVDLIEPTTFCVNGVINDHMPIPVPKCLYANTATASCGGVANTAATITNK